MDALNNCLYFTLNSLFPAYCPICSRKSDQETGICGQCTQDLPFVVDSCPCCARMDTAGHICGSCQQTLPSFDSAVAAFSYADPVSHLIHNLKFHHDLSLARTLGLLLGRHLQQHCPDAEVELLLPVPMHYTRLMQRGFNHAGEIAKVVGKTLGLPTAMKLMGKNGSKTPQRTLALEQRTTNVRGSFRQISALPAKRIAIVDDVMTSGATAEAFASALKLAGAEKVHCWVVARA